MGTTTEVNKYDRQRTKEGEFLNEVLLQEIAEIVAEKSTWPPVVSNCLCGRTSRSPRWASWPVSSAASSSSPSSPTSTQASGPSYRASPRPPFSTCTTSIANAESEKSTTRNRSTGQSR